MRRLPAGVYLPFGGGPRTYNASNYPVQEMLLVLATIAQRIGSFRRPLPTFARSFRRTASGRMGDYSA